MDAKTKKNIFLWTLIPTYWIQLCVRFPGVHICFHTEKSAPITQINKTVSSGHNEKHYSSIIVMTWHNFVEIKIKQKEYTM